MRRRGLFFATVLFLSSFLVIFTLKFPYGAVLLKAVENGQKEGRFRASVGHIAHRFPAEFDLQDVVFTSPKLKGMLLKSANLTLKFDVPDFLWNKLTLTFKLNNFSAGHIFLKNTITGDLTCHFSSITGNVSIRSSMNEIRGIYAYGFIFPKVCLDSIAGDLDFSNSKIALTKLQIIGADLTCVATGYVSSDSLALYVSVDAASKIFAFNDHLLGKFIKPFARGENFNFTIHGPLYHPKISYSGL